MASPPKPPDSNPATPPRGGAKFKSDYSLVDVGELARRGCDLGMANRSQLRRLESKLDLALSGRHPWYERYGLAGIVVVLFMMLIAYTTRTSSASVPEPRPSVQVKR